jgi:ferredoxin
MPLGRTSALRVVAARQRVDERDAVFHRFYRLRPGTPEFEAYYREHPEKKEFDAEVSAIPHLGHPGHATYHSLTSNFQNAATKVLGDVTKEIDWPAAPIEGTRVQASPEEFTRRVKGFARHLGADLVGTTKLDPAHVYSHIGRSPGPWGDPIELDHPNAIAIAVEMSHDMVRHAPDIATTTETMFQYFEVAKVAMIIARYINLLGYEARAHVDSNYRVMCVPVACDAGLGELGRLGLLITREYGPRVRLSVVTTDLPLSQDEPIHFGVQEFCTLCKKCATNCPSDSVDAGDKRVHLGVEKWQTDRDSCYRFWRQRSSDCALCVKTCPYSHPGTVMHDVVRWAIGRNPLARQIAMWGDDLLYGRKPVDRAPLPPWHDHP